MGGAPMLYEIIKLSNRWRRSPLAALEREATGTGHFENAARLYQIQECSYLVGIAGQFDIRGSATSMMLARKYRKFA